MIAEKPPTTQRTAEDLLAELRASIQAAREASEREQAERERTQAEACRVSLVRFCREFNLPEPPDGAYEIPFGRFILSGEASGHVVRLWRTCAGCGKRGGSLDTIHSYCDGGCPDRVFSREELQAAIAYGDAYPDDYCDSCVTRPASPSTPRHRTAEERLADALIDVLHARGYLGEVAE